MKIEKIDEKYRKEIDRAASYIYLNKDNFNREEMENFLFENFFPFLSKEEYKRVFVRDFYRTYSSKDSDNENEIYYLSSEEMSFLNTIEDKKIRKIVLCMIVWRRKENEERDYVRFDFEKILSLFFSGKELKKIKREDLVPLSGYGIDFRVVGSKRPKTCYKLPIRLNFDDIAWSGNKQQIERYFNIEGK